MGLVLSHLLLLSLNYGSNAQIYNEGVSTGNSYEFWAEITSIYAQFAESQ
jgi:hypothetical protein